MAAPDALNGSWTLAGSAADVPFQVVVRRLGPSAADDVLALAIDADARARISRGQQVDIGTYLAAVPLLQSLPISLDAAIEFSLRSLTRGGMTAHAALDALIKAHPRLESAIRTAAALTDVVGATSDIRTGRAEPVNIPLPADFGPVTPSGRARYELRDLLGRGIHGSVYLATDRLLSEVGRPAWVAIKVLGTPHDRSSVAAAHADEACRARRINHPAVVRVLDRGSVPEYGGYIVSEYIDGPSLQTWLMSRSLPLPAPEAARLMVKIARGVQGAHAAGLVHCDLKPDNILLTRGEEPKVTDFGLSIDIEQAARRRASLRADSPIGTLGFMPPEQFQLTDDAFSVLSDIYSLGGMLFYLLTGLLPNGQTDQETRTRLGTRVQDLSPVRFPDSARIDPDLAAICRRALMPRPDERYQSADALAHDLEAWLNHEPIRWIKARPGRRVRLFVKRQPLAAAMAAGILLAVAASGGLAVYLMERSDHRLSKARFVAAKELAAQSTGFRSQILGTLRSLDLLFERESNPDSVDDNWLKIVTILESMLGPVVFDQADPDGVIWSKRFDIVRSFLADAKAAHEENDIASIQWEAVLGYWELRRGDAAGAAQTLAHNLTASRKKLGDDSWTRYVEQLRACADARVALKQARSPGRDATLAAVVAVLEKAPTHFTGRRAGDPAHRLILETLRDAYLPEGLNSPESLHRARALLDKAQAGRAGPPVTGHTGAGGQAR